MLAYAKALCLQNSEPKPAQRQLTTELRQPGGVARTVRALKLMYALRNAEALYVPAHSWLMNNNFTAALTPLLGSVTGLQSLCVRPRHLLHCAALMRRAHICPQAAELQPVSRQYSR